MSKINLLKWVEGRDGPLNEGNMRAKMKKMGYSCTKYAFPPGTTFPDHTHDETKMDSIISGRFELAMFGQKVEMEPGDMVEVPRKVVHNAQVLGNEIVVFFDGSQ